MGSCLSQVEDEPEFQKFVEYHPDDERQIPRKKTDSNCLIVMGAFFFIVAICFIYSATVSDVDRIVKGYDRCGNICGKKNKRPSNIEDTCVGRDMSKLPFLYDDKCVEDCPMNYESIMGKCIRTSGESIKSDISFEIAFDLNLCAAEIVYMTFITFVIVGVIIILFRYFTGCFIWSLLIGATSIAVTATLGIWGAMATTSDENLKDSLFIPAIILTIITLIIVLVLYVLRKRIRMVISMFHEASKAIADMPLLLIQPTATFAAFMLLYIIMGYAYLMFASAGILTKIYDGKYNFIPSTAIAPSYILFSYGTVWLMYFFIGCQDMIVGGAVTAWFFTRNKMQLRRPIRYAISNTFKYHLGTLAFGSLIMLLVNILKRILHKLRRGANRFGCCGCCGLANLCTYCAIERLERIVRYLTKLAYIMTAMHGLSFCRGGKRAVTLLIHNGVKVLCMNSIGTFILFLVQFIIISLTVVISLFVYNKPGVQNVFLPVILSGLIAYCIAKCFLTVYDTTIDAIFLSFCEDCEENDGVTKPYFMSKELMLFVENSKKALGQIEAAANRNAENGAGAQFIGNNQ